MVKGGKAEIRRLKTVPLWVSRQRAILMLEDAARDYVSDDRFSASL
jgi:hypothetical protein